MKKLLLAAVAAISLGGAFATPTFACNVAVPGCQQWMYDQGAAMQRQIIQQQGTPIAPPAPQAPNMGMSFGSINGQPFVVNRLGGWTDIQVGN